MKHRRLCSVATITGDGPKTPGTSNPDPEPLQNPLRLCCSKRQRARVTRNHQLQSEELLIMIKITLSHHDQPHFSANNAESPITNFLFLLVQWPLYPSVDISSGITPGSITICAPRSLTERYNHGTDSLHYAILISRTGLVIFFQPT